MTTNELTETLRDDLETARPAEPEYPRPVLTRETITSLAATAALLAMASPAQRIQKITQIMTENARLLLEVNEHRAARGFESLPGYEPKVR